MKFSTISNLTNYITNINKINFQTIGNMYLQKIEKDTFHKFTKPREANLIVTGNISHININLVKFLDYTSFNFDKVFYVPGIVELSNTNTKYTVEELFETLQGCCNMYNNIHLLNNSSYYWTDNDLQIVGSTYWGKVKDARLFLHSPYFTNMYTNKGLITPSIVNTLHTNSVKYLSTLDINTNKVIISHYPMYTSNEYDEDGIQYINFKNNINHIIKSIDKQN